MPGRGTLKQLNINGKHSIGNSDLAYMLSGKRKNKRKEIELK